MHSKAAVVLMIIMQYYPAESLERLEETLPLFLKSCLTNASPDCRQVARKAFLVWQKIDASGFHELFTSLDVAVQKAICDDAEQFEVVRSNEKQRRPQSRRNESARKIPMSPGQKKENGSNSKAAARQKSAGPAR